MAHLTAMSLLKGYFTDQQLAFIDCKNWQSNTLNVVFLPSVSPELSENLLRQREMARFTYSEEKLVGLLQRQRDCE